MTTPQRPPRPAAAQNRPTNAGNGFDERFRQAQDLNEAGGPPPLPETEGPVENATNSARRLLQRTWDEEAVLDAILTGDQFIENPMNAFNNIAPHWRFFAMPDLEYMTDDTDSISALYANLDQYTQITIAETGVTNFNIKNVQMNSVFGDAQSRSSQMTEITMEINEPGGVQFLDALADAAHEAGVLNYRDFVYYLELSFKGYERTGEINTRAFSDIQNGGRWLWAVFISDIDVNMNTGGGEYKLKMVPRQQQALKDEYHCLLEDCVVKAGTVGEFFDELGRKMSKQWELRFGQDVVSHKFELHGLPNSAATNEDTTEMVADLTPDSVRSMMIWPEEPDLCLAPDSMNDILGGPTPSDERRAASQRDGDEDLADRFQAPPVYKQTVTMPRGQRVSDILDMVFSSCEAAQYLAKDSSANDFSADDAPDRVNDKGCRESVTWQVLPEVRYRSDEKRYDIFSNRYARDITWHIYPRINHNIILSHQQIEAATDAGTQRSLLSAIAARGFLAKRYDYLFTGQNTEVLNFDLAFNFAWQAVLPRFQSGNGRGGNQFSEQSMTHALANDQLESAQWQTDPLGYYQESRDKELEALAEMRAKLEEFRRQREEGELEQETVDELQDLIEEVRRRTGIRRTRDEWLDSVRDANPIDAPNDGKVYNQDYIESIRYFEAGRRPVDTYRFRLPVSVTGVNESSAQVGMGMPSQYHAGKSLYGAVLNQAYGVVTPAFQKITISVRGDPYWLGEGSYEQDILHRENLRGQRDGRLSENTTGYNCFMLRFKYPTGFDESGRQKVEDNETVSGIYQVTGVKTTVTNGQMRHDLTAIRVPLIDIFAALTAQQAESEPDNE